MRSIADSATSTERPRIAVDPSPASPPSRKSRLSAMPSDAEAWKSPEEQVALEVRHGPAGREAAPQGGGRQLDTVEGDRVAARGAHAERVPVVVDAHTRGRPRGPRRTRTARRHRRRRSAPRRQQDGRRGRHRAEDLVAVDAPAAVGADRARSRHPAAAKSIPANCDRCPHDWALGARQCPNGASDVSLGARTVRRGSFAAVQTGTCTISPVSIDLHVVGGRGCVPRPGVHGVIGGVRQLARRPLVRTRVRETRD